MNNSKSTDLGVRTKPGISPPDADQEPAAADRETDVQAALA